MIRGMGGMRPCAAALVLACGCAKPATAAHEVAPPSATLAAAAVHPSASAPAAVASIPPSTTPPPIELPDVVACTLADPHRGHLPPLALRRGGHPYGIPVAAGRLTVALPADAGAATVADAVIESYSVRGVVALDDLELHAARPFAGDGFAVPMPYAHLRYLGAADGGVAVAFALPARVHSAGPADEARATALSCDELTLRPATYDPRELLPSGAGATLLLAAGRAVALATSPGGAPAARILLEAGAKEKVQVIETSGTWTRIAWTQPEVLLFGWVASTDLAPLPPAGSGHVVGHAVRIPEPPPPGDVVQRGPVVRCAGDVTLVATVGGDIRTVGTLRGNSDIELLDEQSELRQVDLIYIEPAPGAVFLVPKADLKPCVVRAPYP
jgi:hypothetical protein